MDLYIQIRDGNPINHPILGDNLRQVYPGIDLNNLPNNFAKFERYLRPEYNVYQTYEGVTYEWCGDVVKDVHHVRDLTLDEITEKQNFVKFAWIKTGFNSWIFNEDTCSFDPPIPYPTDGLHYYWDEDLRNWCLISDTGNIGI
jgi:hypothetical protein